MFQNRFDQLFLTICKQVGGIEGLLKSFFDFMIRKTDFFYQCDPGDKMGFPPGYNKKLLLGIFEQFQQEHYKRFPKKSPQQFNKKLQTYKKKQQQEKNKKDLPKNVNVQKKSQQKTKNQVKSASNQQKIQSKKQDNVSNLEKIVQTKSQSKPNTNIDLVNTYNGGKNERYSWSQQIREVQVTLQIQTGTKAKQLKVKMDTKHISVKDKNNMILIEGQLYQKINASQSVWKIQTIKGKTYLNFNLQKAEEKIWSTVFVGDPQIDTTKVNNSKNLKDFDQQTQGAIRKIMYQQQRKMQGLPTTQQQKQYQALKAAWDAQGSPFKGTPFDPSKLNLSGFNPNE